MDNGNGNAIIPSSTAMEGPALPSEVQRRAAMLGITLGIMGGRACAVAPLPSACSCANLAAVNVGAFCGESFSCRFLLNPSVH